VVTLRAALGLLHLKPTGTELRLVHRWLDTWTGVAVLAAGLHRVGYQLALIQRSRDRPSARLTRIGV
jgi:hypothetical protein